MRALAIRAAFSFRKRADITFASSWGKIFDCPLHHAGRFQALNHEQLIEFLLILRLAHRQGDLPPAYGRRLRRSSIKSRKCAWLSVAKKSLIVLGSRVNYRPSTEVRA